MFHLALTQPDLAEEEQLTADDITELKRRLNHKVALHFFPALITLWMICII